MTYGDVTAQFAFDVLFDKETKSFPKDEKKLTPLQVLAMVALKSNPVLARNVVMLAARHGLTKRMAWGGAEESVISVTNYAFAMQRFAGLPGCLGHLPASGSMKYLLPEWDFTLKATESDIKGNQDLRACQVASVDEVGSGLYTNFVGLSVKMPSPQALHDGVFEIEDSLKLALVYKNRVMAALTVADLPALISLQPSLPEETKRNMAVQLLSSKCLTGKCVQ